jgi:hypothetical protein
VLETQKHDTERVEDDREEWEDRRMVKGSGYERVGRLDRTM